MELINMTKPMVRIHDIETNQIIDREMTSAEIATHEEIAQSIAQLQAQLSAKETTKQAVLAKLGLTVEELAALL